MKRASKEDIAKSDWASCCRGPILKKRFRSKSYGFVQIATNIIELHLVKDLTFFLVKIATKILKTPIPKDDPLNWTDSKSYKDRLKAARKKTGMQCGMMVVSGTSK